jgi:hypothetical protein
MTYREILRILIKGVLLFVIFNVCFAWVSPLPTLGRISAYNRLFPGRSRLPYGDNPQLSYNISLFNLEAMLASHEIDAGPKPNDEFRVLLIGDSATWGFLLKPEETLSAKLNSSRYILPDGKRFRSYNLGYPVMSLTKDLIILSHAVQYQADLIVWLVTLESFPYDKQLSPPLVQNNPNLTRNLIQTYRLRLDINDPTLVDPTFFKRTLVGQRRALADLLRLQLYGVLWAATGIDQYIPEGSPQRMEDLPADTSFHDLSSPLQQEDLAFDVLRAGIELAEETPVLIINEPMFISQGENSDVRYNFFYPRWAYDEYRLLLAEECTQQGWHCIDLWDVVPAEEFTNTAIHITPGGTTLFAQQVYKVISDIIIAE